MRVFNNAIIALYKSSYGDTLRGLLTGGLWTTSAPEKASGSYGCYSYTVDTGNTFDEEVKDISLTFELTAITEAFVESAYAALFALFHHAVLPVSGWETTVIEEVNAEKSYNDKKWKYRVVFHVRLQTGATHLMPGVYLGFHNMIGM